MIKAEVRKESCCRSGQYEEDESLNEKDRDGGLRFWLDLFERKMKSLS